MLSEKRQGEIALMVLKETIYEKGVDVSCKTKRGIPARAKRLGIDPDELMEFAEDIVRATVDRVFSKK